MAQEAHHSPRNPPVWSHRWRPARSMGWTIFARRTACFICVFGQLGGTSVDLDSPYGLGRPLSARRGEWPGSSKRQDYHRPHGRNSGHGRGERSRIGRRSPGIRALGFLVDLSCPDSTPTHSLGNRTVAWSTDTAYGGGYIGGSGSHCRNNPSRPILLGRLRGTGSQDVKRGLAHETVRALHILHETSHVRAWTPDDDVSLSESESVPVRQLLAESSCIHGWSERMLLVLKAGVIEKANFMSALFPSVADTRVSAEAGRVTSTVDLAEIRGLGTTLTGIRHAPVSLSETRASATTCGEGRSSTRARRSGPDRPTPHASTGDPTRWSPARGRTMSPTRDRAPHLTALPGSDRLRSTSA